MDPSLQMRRDDDIAVVVSRKRFDHDVVSITDVVFDHRLTSHDQRVDPFILRKRTFDLKERSVRINVERSACGDSPFERNPCRPLDNFDAPALSWYPGDPPFLFQHDQMVVDMASARHTQCVPNLAIGGWHAFRFDATNNEFEHLPL